MDLLKFLAITLQPIFYMGKKVCSNDQFLHVNILECYSLNLLVNNIK